MSTSSSNLLFDLPLQNIIVVTLLSRCLNLIIHVEHSHGKSVLLYCLRGNGMLFFKPVPQEVGLSGSHIKRLPCYKSSTIHVFVNQ